MLWLMLTVACQAPPHTTTTTGLDPAAASAGVRVGLDDALQLWRTEHYTEAQQAVQQTYATHFEPLEARLDAAAPPLTRLSLEYDFGRLTWAMRRRGSDAVIADAVRGLQQRTTQTLSLLVVEPPVEGTR